MNIKKKSKFVVPNYGAKSRKGVKNRWRHQRGIDNKKRIMRSGYGAIPKIGYKNDAIKRNLDKNGLQKVIVSNHNELKEAMQIPNVSIVLHHALSKRKKLEIQKQAESSGLKISNRVKQ
ncbi:MAG: eL32 family ribosomal protein [Candidatus Micrarchaeia archaeon]